MKATSRNIPGNFPYSGLPLQATHLILLLGLVGSLRVLAEEGEALVYLQATLLKLTEGQRLFEGVDLPGQTAQLLHFLLDILF